MADDVMERLAALGLALPEPMQPLGAYLPVVEAGAMLFVSMQGPMVAGQPKLVGLVGGELTVEEGRLAARLATLNALSQMHRYLGGFGRVRQIVRVEGYVACTDDFERHPYVLDGASELLAAVFAGRAGHARSLCGVRNLPGRLPVAVAVTAELKAP
ncbi:RidA family protein [Cupriavidus sp. 2TAF22]|uniref:RidA family protein n=1 Tax=unclassified Cupriavidus TaxID=2640874 RepID=UPI003F90BF34